MALKDAITKAGVYPVPLGTTGISAVDVRDIAEAAAIALTGDGHLGKTYNLIGPDILSGDGAASIWSKLLGKRIRYGGHDMNAFEEEMRKKTAAWAVFDILLMLQSYLGRGCQAGKGGV